MQEKSFLQAISRPKIKASTLEEIDELFKSCFTLIGLKGQNYPNHEETVALYQYLLENYGEHTTSEIFLAFKMAVQGKLSLGLDDVKCYENFSCLYLSTILTAYRNWAAQTYRQLEPILVNPEEEKKYLEGPRPETHWGEQIDLAYTHFLSFGDENWKHFPTAFYDQLVKDELIEKDFWLKMMPAIRERELAELYKEKTKLSIGSTGFSHGERKDFAESIRGTNIKTIQKQIDDYINGKKDGELEIRAKQRCVIRLFKLYKEKYKEHLYARE